MKFLDEKQVPERVRLYSPTPKPEPPKDDPVASAIDRLTAALKSLDVKAPDLPPIDLSPVAELIQRLPAPATVPAGWRFKIVRDKHGLMTDIIATRT